MIETFYYMYPTSIRKFYSEEIPTLEKNQPEIYDWAKILSEVTGKEIEKVLLVNNIVSMSSWCTSILAMRTDGEVIHARNLDFDRPKQLQSLVSNLEFRRKGELVFRATQVVGFYGIYTAVKPGKFSMSYNVREVHTAASPLAEVEQSLRLFVDGRRQFAAALLQVFLEKETYAEALAFLSTVAVDTTGYVALASGSEGAILSRGRLTLDHLDTLSHATPFLVATNADTWDPEVRASPAFFPRKELRRQQHALRFLSALDRATLTPELIYSQVLDTEEVTQPITIFSETYLPQSGSQKVYLRKFPPASI